MPERAGDSFPALPRSRADSRSATASDDDPSKGADPVIVCCSRIADGCGDCKLLGEAMWATGSPLSGCSVSSAATGHGKPALSCLQDGSGSLLLPANKSNPPSPDLTSVPNLLHFREGFQASLRSTSSLLPTFTRPGSQRWRIRNRKFLVMNVATEPKYDLLWWKRTGPINMREIHSPQELISAQHNAGEKLVVVIFFGTWCRSCRVLHPKLCKLAEDYGHVEFLKVNMEENRSMCTDLMIKILPFFHFYRGEEGLLDAFSCSLTKLQKFENAIELHSSDHYSIGSPVRQKLRIQQLVS